jgi:hypothetical protein
MFKMNKDGHVEFAMMLWVVSIAFFGLGVLIKSKGLAITGIVFFCLGATHPYFWIAPFSFLLGVGYGLWELAKWLAKKVGDVCGRTV